jgi:hypothetical protein
MLNNIAHLLRYKWTWISIKCPNGPHQGDFRSVYAPVFHHNPSGYNRPSFSGVRGVGVGHSLLPNINKKLELFKQDFIILRLVDSSQRISSGCIKAVY